MSVSTVKEVMSDQPAYLSKHFTIATLSPNLLKKLPADSIQPAQKPLVLLAEVDYEGVDGKKETWQNKVTFTDLGQGIFQYVAEASSNDIPFKVNYGLNYRGLIDLRWQNVPLVRGMTDPLVEVKDIKRFDALPSAENQEFTVEFLSGNEIRLANFIEARRSCKATRLLAAADIHKKLEGKALEMECQMFVENLLDSRGKWVFLQNYGIAIQTEEVATRRKAVFRVVDVGG
ncbi:hypothetical protein [Azoarcus sp. TTM-91]|uniref:hypothetical protein n=1 Tax=Azoarcus sp. TTM-91 TaxID=2691581 RepID=UPI00145CC403|nr:hypothetical protein [Azoarcus sp. TTM-91]